MKKKIFALLLAAAMLLSLAACGDKQNANDTPDNSSASGSDAQTGDGADQESHEAINNSLSSSGVVDLLTLEADASRTSTANSDQRYSKVVIPNEEVPDLLPYNTQSGPKASICVEIYETLFDNLNAQILPHLASGYTEVDDTHVQVTLYENIYDWEGNNITADDVVFSYNLTVDSGYANDFNYFKSVAAIDTYTVEFTWTEAITSLTSLTSMLCNVNIVSEKAYGEHSFTTDPVGTGPYTVDSFQVGVAVHLKANDNYWQTDDSLRSPLAKANVEEIEFDIVTDSSMQLVALEAGQLDYSSISSSNIDSFVESGKYLVGSLSNPFMVSLIPNMSSESLCQDENLRLAIYYAIDNVALTEGLGMYSFYPLKTFASPVYSDYQSEWSSQVNYNSVCDVELAKQYLEESSYSGETLKIMCSGLETNQKACVIIQNFLLEIGIKTEIESWDQSMIFSMCSEEGNWDLLLDAGRSGSGLCISRMVSEFVASEIPYGKVKSFVDDPTLQEMIQTCNSKDGYSAELTNDIIEYIIDHVYAYGCYSNTGVFAMNSAFAQIQLYSNNTIFVFGACDYYLD